MAEIREHLDSTYFAWKGDVGDDAIFYTRIQSPVIWIDGTEAPPTFDDVLHRVQEHRPPQPGLWPMTRFATDADRAAQGDTSAAQSMHGLPNRSRSRWVSSAR